MARVKKLDQEYCIHAVQVIADFVARNHDFFMKTYNDLVTYRNMVRECKLISSIEDTMMLAYGGIQYGQDIHWHFTPKVDLRRYGIGNFYSITLSESNMSVDVKYIETTPPSLIIPGPV